MLLNDQQVAINRLHVAFQEASDQYTASARDIAEDADLVAAFETLADERQRAEERLAEISRQQGLLPRAPDPDREQLHALVTQAAATLTGDSRQVVLDERLTSEIQLADLLRQTLTLELPDEARARLDALVTEVEHGIATLNRLATRT